MTARLLAPLLAVVALAAAAPAAHAASASDGIGAAGSLTGAGPHAVTYDTDGATVAADEPTHVNEDYHRSVWVKWTATSSANVRLDNCGDNASVGTQVVVYKGPSVLPTYKNITKLVVGPSADIPYFTCEAGIQTFTPTAGQTYYFAIVRSKYMPASDPGGTLQVEQRTTKPTVTFKTSATQFGAKVKVEFSSANNVQFICTLDNNPPQGCSSNGDNGSFEHTFTSDAPHTLKVTAKNQWLVTGNAYSWVFTADGLAPDTVIDSPAPQFIGPYTALFHTPSGDGVTFSCKVNNDQPQTCSSPHPVPHTQTSGYHVLQITAKDKWGNVDKTPAVQKLYVTNYAPEQPATEPPSTPTTRQPAVQQPVVQPSTTTRTTTTTPAAPCAPRIVALTRSQRTIRRSGMRVRITGDGRNICVVKLALRAGRRVVAHRSKTIGPATNVIVLLKPQRRVAASTRIRLVKGA